MKFIYENFDCLINKSTIIKIISFYYPNLKGGKIVIKRFLNDGQDNEFNDECYLMMFKYNNQYMSVLIPKCMSTWKERLDIQ